MQANSAGRVTLLLLLQRPFRVINSLDVKTSNTIEWMKDNDMIANPNKFKAIVLTKTDHNIQLVLDWNSAGKPFPVPKQLIF